MKYADVKNHLFIPEGGFGETGAVGASDMSTYFSHLNPTHIIVPVGTATTLAGLMHSADKSTNIIGVSVLKGFTDIYERLSAMLQNPAFNQLTIWDDFHFGGYAKYNNELLDFMNDLYRAHKIPTDFVYTGKMMYALMIKIKSGYFKKGSRIVMIHTGGLQGNLSLPAGTLMYE